MGEEHTHSEKWSEGIDLEHLSSLFTQIVYPCASLGLIGFEHLAIDGQKIEANASFRKSKNLKQVKKEYEKTRLGLDKLLSGGMMRAVSAGI